MFGGNPQSHHTPAERARAGQAFPLGVLALIALRPMASSVSPFCSRSAGSPRVRTAFDSFDTSLASHHKISTNQTPVSGV